VSERANVFERTHGEWWAECLVCTGWVSTRHETRGEAEQSFGRHWQNDPHPLFDRWGHDRSSGVYVLFEVESSEGWKKSPPDDAIRVWQRKPGVPDDDDHNWSTWLERPQVCSWMAEKGYDIDEWLPEGVEPDWRSA